jgi:hypothetical protein
MCFRESQIKVSQAVSWRKAVWSRSDAPLVKIVHRAASHGILVGFGSKHVATLFAVSGDADGSCEASSVASR